MLTPAEIEDFTSRLAAALEPQRIILFGSYAKGTATPHSDLDLLVVKETTLPKGHRADAVAALLAATLTPIDVHVYTPEEVAELNRESLGFLANVLATGLTVFEARPASAR